MARQARPVVDRSDRLGSRRVRGSVMAQKRLRKFPSTERWIRLPHHLLRCPAWVTMSPRAKALLLHLWERHNGVNNGEISYSIREADEIGISSSAAARALRELIG